MKINHLQKQIKGSQHYMRKDFYNGEGKRTLPPSTFGYGLGLLNEPKHDLSYIPRFWEHYNISGIQAWQDSIWVSIE